jgi:hypothetical protein
MAIPTGIQIMKARRNPVRLDAEQIERLTKINKAKSEELRRAQRARILLMAANNDTSDTIAKEVYRGHPFLGLLRGLSSLSA